MGALIETAPALQIGVGPVSIVISILSMGLYVLWSAQSENDDDDSTPGGGLMQPVS